MTDYEWEKVKYFKPHEFACKCGCGLCNPGKKLVYKLECLRRLVNKKIIISSGCRCEEYNKKIGGTSKSSHLTGLAADIKIYTPRGKYTILQAVLFNEYFGRIGIGEDFIHVDVDEGKTQDIIWNY